jgi:carboxylesterase type B
MKSIDTLQLKRAVSNNTLNELQGDTFGGLPRYDNTTVFSPEALEQRTNEGRYAKVPVLLGTAEHEGDSVIPWTRRGINYTTSDILTLAGFHCPIAEEAKKLANQIPTYRYLYRGIFPSLQFYPWLRSYHGQDVTLLFGGPANNSNPNTDRNSTTDSTTATTSTNEQEAAIYLQSAFATFVKDPSRGLLEKFGWPLYSPNSTTNDTLIELFKDNKVGAEFTNPGEYDRACGNIPFLSPEEFSKRPPPCDPCFD